MENMFFPDNSDLYFKNENNAVVALRQRLIMCWANINREGSLLCR